jgi:hypothetical protein
MTALSAAAEIKLQQEFKDVFQAVMTLVRRVAKDRNKLAHWCWATSQEMPDALLLVEPEWKTAFTAGMQHVQYTSHGPSLDHIYVLRLSDAQDILKRMIEVRDYAGRITGTIWKITPLDKRMTFLAALSNEPPVRDALNRIISGRKNPGEG